MVDTKKLNKLVSIGVLSLIAIQPCQAGDRGFMKDTSTIGRSYNGVVMSNQLLELGTLTPNSLRLEGEQCLRTGHVEKAITVLQRSVELAPLDMDGRILYAEALEKKLIKQERRDPSLYNYCIKQWFFVVRKCEFEDQKMQAMQHLQSLCGKTPKWHEMYKEKFLKKVLIPEDGSVKVALGGEHGLSTK